MPLANPTVTHIQELAARYPSKQSAIIPALWAVQHEQGYVTDAAMGEIAQHLGLPPSLIEATASFYSMFLTRPEGRHDMVICVNAPCMLRGADEMAGYLKRQLGVRDGQTTADGAITWHSTIECLGACGCAAAAAPAFRPETSGASCPKGCFRATWSATPTRASPAASRIAT